MLRPAALGWIFASAVFAQPPALVFNNGQPYVISATAGTPVTFSDAPVPLTTDHPVNVLIIVQNTSWLSVGIAQDGLSCDDPSIQYEPQLLAQVVTTNALLCFQVNSSSSTADPSYVPQGWYTGYLQVNFADSGGVVLPISLQVTPSGYLHLQDVSGNSLDGSSATLDTTLPGGLVISASINTNTIDDSGAPPPATVNFTFAAKDPNSGLPPPWLRVTDSSGTIASSPQSTPFTFHLSVDPSKVPPGSTSLNADFVVKSTNGFQDTSVVRVMVNSVPAPCTYSLTGAQSITASAGTGAVSVVTQTNCSWAASSDASWLRITGAASGIGSSNIGYAYDANTSASRIGHIVVGTSTFALTQVSGQSTAVRFLLATSPLAGPVAAGSIVSGYGTDLANTTVGSTTTPLATTLGGTTISIVDSTGATALAPLFYVSPVQVNFLVPSGVAKGNASITVTSGDGTASSGTVAVVGVAPGLFVLNTSGLIAANVITVDTSGNQIYSNCFQIEGSSIVPLAVNLGPPAQQVFLALYGTGIANRSSVSNVSAQIGGTTVPALFAGPVQDAGLDQVNVQIPGSLAGIGDTTITVTADGITSNVAHITIK